MRLKCFYFGLMLTICSCGPTPGNELVDTPQWSDEDRQYLVTEQTALLDSLLAHTQQLSEEQWHFRGAEDSWCIGEVMEHLALHDALFLREIKSSSSLPTPAVIADSLLDEDHYLLDYAQINTDNSGPAPWYLDPVAHWCSASQTSTKFTQNRNAFIDFLGQTDRNLRAYYSTNGRGKRPYRDLHQLVLVSIAHTKRHLTQIETIKHNTDFPLDEI